MLQWIFGIIFAAGIVLLLIGACYTLFSLFTMRAIIIFGIISLSVLGLSIAGMPKMIAVIPVLLGMSIIVAVACRIYETQTAIQTEPSGKSIEEQIDSPAGASGSDANATAEESREVKAAGDENVNLEKGAADGQEEKSNG